MSRNTSIREQHEIEVLKAIIAREEYISRLRQQCKQLKGKFHPQISDTLDLLRQATVEVCDAIIQWREQQVGILISLLLLIQLIQLDHDLPFLYRDFNYLLQIPSDLDFLNEVSVLRRWIGFSLLRNPFIVPYPMEQGLSLSLEEVAHPQHIETGKVDAFEIGGVPAPRMKRLYSPKKRYHSSPYGASTYKRELVVQGSGGGISTRSYLLNEDMRRVRMCELVLLKEEERYGKYQRDPYGRCVPLAMVRDNSCEVCSTLILRLSRSSLPWT